MRTHEYSRPSGKNNDESGLEPIGDRRQSGDTNASKCVRAKRTTRSLNYDGERHIFQVIINDVASLHPCLTYSATQFTSYADRKRYARRTIFQRKRDITRYSNSQKNEGALARNVLAPEWNYASNHIRAASTISMALLRCEDILSFTLNLGRDVEAEVMASASPKADLGRRIAMEIAKDRELRAVFGKRPRFAFGPFEPSPRGGVHTHGWLMARRIPRRLEGPLKKALRRAGGNVPEDREQHQVATTDAYSLGAADYALKIADFTNVRRDDGLFVSRPLLQETEEFYNQYRDRIKPNNSPKARHESNITQSNKNELNVTTDLPSKIGDHDLLTCVNDDNKKPGVNIKIDGKSLSSSQPFILNSRNTTRLSLRCPMVPRTILTPSSSPWVRSRIYGRPRSPRFARNRLGRPLAAGKGAITPNSRPMLEWLHQAALAVHGVEPRPPPKPPPKTVFPLRLKPRTLRNQQVYQLSYEQTYSSSYQIRHE